jgi:hypothetical protein
MEIKHNPHAFTFDRNDLSIRYDYCNNSNHDDAMDIRGYGYLEADDNADSVYLLQNNTHSSHTVFPMPGKHSAHALRRFLQEHLLDGISTDEHEYIMPATHVSDDHLPTLQAQLWLNRVQNDTKMSPHLEVVEQKQNYGLSVRTQYETRSLPPYEDSVSNKTLLFTRHIAFITELLQCKFGFLYYGPFLIIDSEPHLRSPEGTNECLRIPRLSNDPVRTTSSITDGHHRATNPLGYGHSSHGCCPLPRSHLSFPA